VVDPPRKRRAKLPGPNEQGTLRFEQRREEFAHLLQSTAGVIAKRRSAAEADNADIDAAWRFVLNRPPRPWLISFLSDFMTTVGGLAIGYGIGLGRAGEVPSLVAGLFIAMGLVLAVAGLLLRHLSIWA